MTQGMKHKDKQFEMFQMTSSLFFSERDEQLWGDNMYSTFTNMTSC